MISLYILFVYYANFSFSSKEPPVKVYAWPAALSPNLIYKSKPI